MVDHVRLGDPATTTSRRNQNGRDSDAPARIVNRSEHARELAGRLAGLGLPYPGDLAAATDVTEVEPDALIVLVFDGEEALSKGPFKRWGMQALAETADRHFYVLSNAEARATFAALVGEYGSDDWTHASAWAQQLDKITGVRLYGKTERADEALTELTFERLETVDVLVWPSTLDDARRRQATADERIAALRASVEAAAARNPGIHVLAADNRPDSTMLRVVVDQSLLNELLDNAVVERVRPPLRPRLTHADLASAPLPAQPVTPQGAAIGVIDDLVTDNVYLQGAVVARAAFPAGYAWGVASSHGTHVAGIAAYGDLTPLVTSGSNPIGPPIPVLAARVLQQDPADASRTLLAGPPHLQIEGALRWLHANGVRVAVCSINDDKPDESPLPSQWTAIIDTLVRELDMVVVVSAGNVSDIAPAHWRDDYDAYLRTPIAGVAEPGGAALATTVAATAVGTTPVQPTRLAIARQAGDASPFTRVGPTRGRTPKGAAKPEFSAHGGNWSWDSQYNALGPADDPGLCVVTLAPAGARGGKIAASVTGTSFAAPYVAHQVARIATRYPNAGANLLRALTALSVRPGTRKILGSAVVAAYGEPDASRILESGAHRVVFVFEGAIPVNTSQIHTLPIPPAFSYPGLSQSIAAALAFDPPVRRSRRSYIGGRMSLDVVRNHDLEELRATYERQPTTREVETDTSRHKLPLPPRLNMDPGSSTQVSNTLLWRRTRGVGWDVNDTDWHVVVTHAAEDWATEKAVSDGSQRYALAVDITVRSDAAIDLYAQVQEMLRSRVRPRVR